MTLEHLFYIITGTVPAYFDSVSKWMRMNMLINFHADHIFCPCSAFSRANSTFSPAPASPKSDDNYFCCQQINLPRDLGEVPAGRWGLMAITPQGGFATKYSKSKPELNGFPPRSTAGRSGGRVEPHLNTYLKREDSNLSRTQHHYSYFGYATAP